MQVLARPVESPHGQQFAIAASQFGPQLPGKDFGVVAGIVQRVIDQVLDDLAHALGHGRQKPAQFASQAQGIGPGECAMQQINRHHPPLAPPLACFRQLCLLAAYLLGVLARGHGTERVIGRPRPRGRVNLMTKGVFQPA